MTYYYEIYTGKGPTYYGKGRRCECHDIFLQGKGEKTAYCGEGHTDRCSEDKVGPYTPPQENGSLFCEACLDRMMNKMMDIPPPGGFKKPHKKQAGNVALPALKEVRESKGLGGLELSRRTGISETFIRRLENEPEMGTSLANAERLACVLGVRVPTLQGLNGGGGSPPGMAMPRLRELRKEKGIGRRHLAAEIGIHHDTLSDIEAGKHRTRYQIVEKILSALECDIKDVI